MHKVTMIASTMPVLTIHHKTEYRYTRPVAFGEHRIMLRPRDGHDLRVLAGSLTIVPEPMSLRWIHDVFGNSVAIATFDERAEVLSIVSTATNAPAISGLSTIRREASPRARPSTARKCADFATSNCRSTTGHAPLPAIA